jgi:hypothetical protein
VFALKGGDVPSMGQVGRSLRLVVINKDEEKACNVTLSAAGAWGDGKAVWLLPGAKGLMSKVGVTFRAQHYEGTLDGVIAGTALMQPVAPVNVAGVDRGSGGGGGAGVRTEYTLGRLAPGRAVVVTALAA